MVKIIKVEDYNYISNNEAKYGKATFQTGDRGIAFVITDGTRSGKDILLTERQAKELVAALPTELIKGNL